MENKQKINNDGCGEGAGWLVYRFKTPVSCVCQPASTNQKCLSSPDFKSALIEVESPHLHIYKYA